MTEQRLESHIVDWAKAQGGIALKGATNFDTGYPDRVLYIPGGHAHVEVKGTSKRYHLNEKQKVWAGRIIASRTPYFIVESMDSLNHMKDILTSAPAPYMVNEYPINGKQLVLSVNEIEGTYHVHSCKDGVERRIIEATLTHSIAVTIYHVFKQLEALYPNTNYEDI